MQETNSVTIFSDFDGTITTRDTIVFLTEEHGRGAEFRHEMLEAIKSGRLTVFEVIRRELQTVQLSWEEAKRSLELNIQIDPTFPEFVSWCRRRELPLHVISSGLEKTVRFFVGKYGVQIHAHPVECDPAGWRYRVREESRKTTILKAERKKSRIVYIGDGTSDVAAIPFTDLLFAKSYLAEHCRERNLPFEPFESFQDVQRRLEQYLAEDPLLSLEIGNRNRHSQ